MIKLENVNKVYKQGSRALKDINITIQDGEFVFIMGRSGSGKSTLIRLLLKETEPTSGYILVGDDNLQKMSRRNVPKYRRRLGVVFQDFRLLKARNIRENVPRMLQMVGLSSKYKALPAELSGGEQQRVAIARALINKPEILLADEPTGNLDSRNSMEIMHLLEDINSRGTTVIVVTHSHEIVRDMKKRVIVLDRGVVAQDAAELNEVWH